MATIEAVAHGLGGRSQRRPPEFWDRYAAMISDRAHVVALHVSTPPSGLAATVRSGERLLAEVVPGETAVIAGSAAIGTMEILLGESAVPVAARVVERLRDAVADAGGHVMIRRASAAVRRAVNPWGPIEPGPLAIMQALRDEFDPRRVLNPGRFVV